MSNLILEILQKAPEALTAHEITNQFNLGGTNESRVPQSEVNRILYDLLKQDRIVTDQQHTPPTWSMNLANSTILPSQNNSPSTTIVLVDLGNVHDTMQHLEPYA